VFSKKITFATDFSTQGKVSFIGRDYPKNWQPRKCIFVERVENDAIVRAFSGKTQPIASINKSK